MSKKSVDPETQQRRAELRDLKKNRAKVKKDFTEHRRSLLRVIGKSQKEMKSSFSRTERAMDRLTRRILVLEGRGA